LKIQKLLKKLLTSLFESFKVHKVNLKWYKWRWKNRRWIHNYIRFLSLIIIVLLLTLTPSLVYRSINKVNLTLPSGEPPNILLQHNISDLMNLSDWYDWIGREIVYVGDINGDNRIDAVISMQKFIDPFLILLAIDLMNGSLLWSFQTYSHVHSSPIADIDDDGKLEIILASGDVHNNRGLCSLNLEDGSILWLNNSIGIIRDFPVLEDIDNNGLMELIICIQETDQLCSYNAEDGSFLWKTNNSEFTESTRSTQFLSSPTVGDINGDGFKEVIVSSNDNSIISFNGSDGTFLWKTETEWWNQESPVLGDIDNDGLLDVIVGSGDTNLYVIDGRDGSVKWSFKTRLPSEFSMSPSLGDINNDGYLDIIISNDKKELLVINGKSKKSIWSINMPAKIIQSASIIDLDNDNKLDVLVRSRDDFLYALSGCNGKTIWKFKLNGWSSTDDSPPYIVDIDSDDHFEILILSDDKNSNSTLLYLLNFLSDYDSGFRVFWRSNGGNFQKTGSAEDIDNDKDGLSNYSEGIIGTNPLLIDTDLDNLPDNYELTVLQTDPLALDTNKNGLSDGEDNYDMDNLSNLDEYLIGTDPLDWDTDNDLLSDSCDKFPLYADGWFYWSTILVCIISTISYLLIKRLKRRIIVSEETKKEL